MPAPVKLTTRRERRLLTLIENGASVAEASRAIEVSRTSIYRRARADASFAMRLQLARGRGHRAAIAAGDWSASTKMAETDSPEHWALPELGLPDVPNPARWALPDALLDLDLEGA